MSTAVFIYLLSTLVFSIFLSIAMADNAGSISREKVSPIAIILCTLFWPLFLFALIIISIYDLYKDILKQRAKNILNKYPYGASNTETFMQLLSEVSDKDLHRILTAANKNAISINSKHIDLLKKEIENRKFEKEVLDG